MVLLTSFVVIIYIAINDDLYFSKISTDHKFRHEVVFNMTEETFSKSIYLAVVIAIRSRAVLIYHTRENQEFILSELCKTTIIKKKGTCDNLLPNYYTREYIMMENQDMNLIKFKNKIIKNVEKSLIEQLKEEKLPIILFGGGSMSYSIRKILKNNGIKISACWIDNAVIEVLEDGIEVFSYEGVCNKYNKFCIVFGHSKYELAEQIVKKPEIERCYCLVNVCYGQWTNLKYSFVEEHLQDYYKSYCYLEDDFSRECLLAFLNTRISEDYHYLLPICERETATYFDNPFFEIGNEEYLLDVGAYIGDTIKEFVNKAPNYKRIAAIEPDKESFIELKKYIANEGLKNIDTYEVGCWDKNTTLHFGQDEESSSVLNEGGNEIRAMKIDDLFRAEDISMIKINYLHGVYECIAGARNLLRTKKPRMMVMVGFDEWALIRIPRLIKEINRDYKLSLRYASAMPARLILFAY